VAGTVVDEPEPTATMRSGAKLTVEQGLSPFGRKSVPRLILVMDAAQNRQQVVWGHVPMDSPATQRLSISDLATVDCEEYDQQAAPALHRLTMRTGCLAILSGAALSDAATNCTGSSTKLAPAECDAWGDFYDDAGGKEWTKCSDAKWPQMARGLRRGKGHLQCPF